MFHGRSLSLLASKEAALHSRTSRLDLLPALLRQRHIFGCCLLRGLDETMEKIHRTAFNRKDHARYPVGQLRSHFPQVTLQVLHQGHAQRPAELHRFDVVANHLAIKLRKLVKPFTYGLTTEVILVELNA